MKKFIGDCIERGSAEEYMKVEDIYQLHLRFCKAESIEPLTKNSLTRLLNNENIGATRIKSFKGVSDNYRYGIRVKQWY